MQSIRCFFCIVLFVLLSGATPNLLDCSKLEPAPDTKANDVISCIVETQRQIAKINANLESINILIKHINTEFDRIKSALYDDVDAVYTISESFTENDIKKLADKPLIFHQFIYADPKKHKVKAVIFRRQNSFNIKLCVNKVCTEKKNDVMEDITELLNKNPLKPGDAGAQSELFAYPEHIQLIELMPIRLNWDAGEVASVDGYITVQRATSAGGVK